MNLRKRRLSIALYLAALAIVLFAGLEWWARTRANIPNFRDERRLYYQYDDVLGWIPRKNSEHQASLSQEFTVRHNSEHFRDREREASKKPAICVLGDSFVWGFDVDAQYRFTDKLQERLPEWEIFNMGVSGYSTDQEFLLLQRYYEKFKPKLVLLVFACDKDGDDRGGNSSNKAYRYFKPYFALQDGSVVQQGTPVPKNSAYRIDSLPGVLRDSHFLRYLAARYPEPKQIKFDDMTHAILGEMNRYLSGRATQFVVAHNDPDPALAEFCKTSGIPLIDLSAVDSKYRFPEFGKHWTEEGHALVSEAVYSRLMEFLPKLEAGGQTGR